MRLGPVIAVILGAAALVGCGSKTVTVVSTVNGPPSTSSSTSSTTPTTTASTTTSTPSSTTSTSTSATATRTIHLTAFATPSGNISCLIIDGGVRCDIKQHTWTLPPRPKSCPPVVDFGQGLAVGPKGRAALVCAGDTVADPSDNPLQYGSATSSGNLSCDSEEDGVTCRNTATGHGFFLSVQSYRVF